MYSQIHSKIDRDWISDREADVGTPKNFIKDNGRLCKSELDAAKRSISKLKGTSVIHHGNRINFSNSSKVKNGSSNPSANKFYSEIVHEIEDEKDDEVFFGHLEADDQQYDDFNNIVSKIQEEQKNGEEDKNKVRRSQRRIARQSFADLIQNGHLFDDGQEDGYRLIKWTQYDNSTKKQPIEVYLSFQAFLIMNIHSHLFHHEVIGFNAGYVFTSKNRNQAVYIHDVYPAVALENTFQDRTKSVEMDPESSELNRKLAETRGQTIWGWYHSHPIFETSPSKIDIFNQHSYQHFFNSDCNKPFVAFIVGPYSPKLNSSKVISELKCFHVVNDSDSKFPYELTYHIVPQK